MAKKENPIRTLTKEEAKVGFKGKTVILKETDTSEKRKEISVLLKDDKLQLLYINVINDVTNWVYEKK